MPRSAEPGPVRTDLPNHAIRGAGALPGWPGVIFSAPFVLAGAGMILVSADVFGPFEEMRGARRDAPWFVLFAAGLAFLSAGLILGVTSARHIVRRRRFAAARATYPGQPWMWDHAWDPAGARDDEGGQVGAAFALPLFLVAFLFPFNWLAAAGEAPWPVWIIVGLFDLIGVATLGRALHVGMRRLRYGRSRLRYERFPFHTGDELRVALPRPRSLPAGSEVRATLRCVHERTITTTTGRNRRTKQIVHRVLQRHDQTLRAHGPALRLAFAVPPDAPSTSLADPEPVYWEVALESQVAGVDFAGTYLVPVYGKPGGGNPGTGDALGAGRPR